MLEFELQGVEQQRRTSTDYIHKELQHLDHDDLFNAHSSFHHDKDDRKTTTEQLKSAKICKKCQKNIDPVYNQLVREEKVNQDIK